MKFHLLALMLHHVPLEFLSGQLPNREKFFILMEKCLQHYFDFEPQAIEAYRRRRKEINPNAKELE